MVFRKFIKPLLAAAALFAIMAQPAAAQSGGSNVEQQIINGVIQNIVESVRDQIMRRRLTPPPVGMNHFSAEESDFNSKDPFAAKGMSNPFGALAYAKSPILAAPPPSAWLYGVNLIGNGDRAISIAAQTHIETITGAFDVTKIGIFTATDALTFIGTGSHTWSRAETPALPALPFVVDSSIPSASGTLSYLNGGFSADFTALASWTRSRTNAPLVVIPDSSSIAYTGNAQYRFDFPYSVWFEPTAGVTYTEVYTANFGTKLADTTEVHGGGRVGTEMKWMGFTIQPVLSGAVFRIVDSNFVPVLGPVPAGAVPTPGVLGGRGSGKITVLWTPNFSSYLEVHGSGIASTKTVQPPLGNPAAVDTIGAQAGLRYTWN